MRVGTDNIEAEAARLVERGATILHYGRGPHTWITIADPEGNEFCLTGTNEQRVGEGRRRVQAAEVVNDNRDEDGGG